MMQIPRVYSPMMEWSMSISFKSIACLVGLVMCLNAPVWAQQPMTSPDGGIASVGAKADSADTNPLSVNTLMAFTKGLVKIFSDVWDSVNHRLKVDGSGVVQPVSATALPLPNGAASESTLSARLSDSTFTGRFPAAFTSADTIAAQTASFVHGGMMGWNSAASKWDRLQLDASDNLKVSIQNGSIAVTGTFWQATQPVSGTITANAGTNLNTSALALESGGNLAAVASVGGSTADVAVTADATGTLSSKLRGLVKMISDVWDGTNHWLKVSIQNATMAVTQSGTWTVQPGNTPNTVAWKVDGSAVTQPVSGTFWQATQPVSGTFWQATQPVSLASVPSHPVTNAGTNLNTSALALESGGNLAAVASVGGSTADVAVTADATGTLSSKLRGLVKMISDVWDGTNHWLKVSIQNATMAVTQSGTWTVQPGNTPNTVAWKVDGSAVTQPVSGTFWQATQPVSGTFWQATQPVSLASVPSHPVTNAGTFAVQPSSSSATGAAPPAAGSFTVGLGSGATGGLLTGITVADSFVPVNVSTATTTLLVTGVSGRHIRITSLDISTAGANNVALISGTGATCGTGTTGMNGGTTAATGWNFAANGGITRGSGIGTVYRTTAAGDSVCVVTSATTQLSGNLSYAIY